MKGQLSNQGVPLRARIFFLSVTALGIIAIGHSAYSVLTGLETRWLYLLALTLFASCFPVTVPIFRKRPQSMTVTMADVFVFGGLLLFGPQVGVMLAAAEAIVSSFRVRIVSLNKILFNVGQLALVALVVGHLFASLRGWLPITESTTSLAGFWAMLILIAVCAACYFLLNSILVATALHLVTDQKLARLWSKNFVCALPANLINGSAAAFIFLLTQNADAYLTGIIFSTIIITYYGFAFWFKRRAEGLSIEG